MTARNVLLALPWLLVACDVPNGVEAGDGSAVCGDGVLEGLEQCDDGNLNSNDGCSSSCLMESNPLHAIQAGPSRLTPEGACDLTGYWFLHRDLESVVPSLGALPVWTRGWAWAAIEQTGDEAVIVDYLHCGVLSEPRGFAQITLSRASREALGRTESMAGRTATFRAEGDGCVLDGDPYHVVRGLSHPEHWIADGWNDAPWSEPDFPTCACPEAGSCTCDEVGKSMGDTPGWIDVDEDGMPYIEPSRVNARGSRESTMPWFPERRTIFKLFLAARTAAAFWSVISDCDETFNYWEPLSFMLYGKGFQTWEYGPKYGLR